MSFNTWAKNGVSNSKQEKGCQCGLDFLQFFFLFYLLWDRVLCGYAEVCHERQQLTHSIAWPDPKNRGMSCSPSVSKQDVQLHLNQTFSAGSFLLAEKQRWLSRIVHPHTSKSSPHINLSGAGLWGRGLPREITVSFPSFLDSKLWPRFYRRKNLQQGTPELVSSTFV